MQGTEPKELAAEHDRLLEALLQAEGDAVDAEIERLIAEAGPTIRTVTARYVKSETLFSREDADDLVATIHLRLLERLRRLREEPQTAIRDFRAYAATLAYNVVHDVLRARNPERARLKNRVRRALTHDSRLAMWNVDAGPAGGLSPWVGRTDVLPQVTFPCERPAEEGAGILVELFETTRQPVLVDGIVDLLAQPALQWNEAFLEEIPANEPDAATQLEDRDFARALWEEIRELRPLQRKALLLNLRYGGDLDILSLLMLTGIARFAEIAGVLEMPGEKLAALWKELPIEDQRIAEMMNITRQQVINLRSAARERLSRRLSR